VGVGNVVQRRYLHVEMQRYNYQAGNAKHKFDNMYARYIV